MSVPQIGPSAFFYYFAHTDNHSPQPENIYPPAWHVVDGQKWVQGVKKIFLNFLFLGSGGGTRAPNAA